MAVLLARVTRLGPPVVVAVAGLPLAAVFDRTGLAGTFDFNVVWAPARTGPAAARPEDVVAITTALQEQFGLKLESRREMLDVLVIDSVERPTPD